jgi:hypothetical protein
MTDDLARRDDNDAVGDYLDVAALFAEAIPGLGGAISNVLGGFSSRRKQMRFLEVIEGVAADLRGFKSEVSEQYVRSEDFEDLFEETLRQAARERSAEKRAVYRDFIVNAIREPGEPYDEQIETLRLIGRLSSAHIRVLAAINQSAPETPTFSIGGAPVSVLQRRLGDIDTAVIVSVVEELDNLRLTKLAQRLQTMMTGRGAEELRSAITPLGRRVLGFARGD